MTEANGCLVLFLSDSRHPLASVANRCTDFPLLSIPFIMDSSILNPGKSLLVGPNRRHD